MTEGCTLRLIRVTSSFETNDNVSHKTSASKYSDPIGYHDNFMELYSFKDGDQTFFFTSELLGIYQLDFYSEIGGEKHYFKNARYLITLGYPKL